MLIKNRSLNGYIQITVKIRMLGKTVEINSLGGKIQFLPIHGRRSACVGVNIKINTFERQHSYNIEN